VTDADPPADEKKDGRIHLPAAGLGAASAGALGYGAVALGAVAVGAFAVGALVIGGVALRKRRNRAKEMSGEQSGE
jgi:hypothetical protein